MTDAPDLQVVTQIQQQVWSKGDFAKIGTAAQIVQEELCEAVDVLPGRRVLDVACGGGNGAIAAARRNATAVGLDYVPALLERGRERAAAEGYEVEFVEGDAQDLPFEDASFDYVISTFGAMFAPDQERTAAELLRVCRLRGQDRHGELAAPRPRRRGIVQDHRRACAAAPGHPARRALGDRGPAQGAVRRRCVGAHAQRASPELPVPLAGAVARVLQGATSAR